MTPFAVQLSHSTDCLDNFFVRFMCSKIRFCFLLLLLFLLIVKIGKIPPNQMFFFLSSDFQDQQKNPKFTCKKHKKFFEPYIPINFARPICLFTISRLYFTFFQLIMAPNTATGTSKRDIIENAKFQILSLIWHVFTKIQL